MPGSDTASAVRRVVLGTAGHIDHGKTALVSRLTGTNTDSLPEEQERGMTIDVGYAAFELDDGTEIGLLDVPGHERLVRTMVAAATAMDLALLVVAADDGPMPQTREHVEILDVLGVTRLVVALTKVDLVDDETCQIAEQEIEELLAKTGMVGAKIQRVSSATGEGIDDLRRVIAAAIPPVEAEGGLHGAQSRVFRMPIMRAFLVKGRGTIVTGIPISGHIADGDKVEVLPRAWGSRVRGIQVHHRASDGAHAGHRAALALADIHADKVKRGMVVTTAGVLKPVHRIAVRLQVLADTKPVKHTSRARLHVGADQAVVRVHLPRGKTVPPGGVELVELESDQPFVAAPGDRFVLRQENAQGTIGGGVVVEVLESRLPRRRDALLDAMLARATALHDPAVVVGAVLKSRGDKGALLAEIAALTAVRPDALPAVLETLQADGRAVPVGRAGCWVDGPAFEKVVSRVEETVVRLHEKDRALDSLPLSVVRSAFGRVAAPVLQAAVDALFASGALVRTPQGQVRHKSHSVDLPPEDKARCDKISAALAQGAGQPPSVDDLAGDLGMTHPDVMRALRLLDARGLVFKAEDFWFDGAWVEEMKAQLRVLASKQGGFTPADARTVMNTSRKWVIPLLESLDRSGFSRRAGSKRIVKD